LQRRRIRIGHKRQRERTKRGTPGSERPLRLSVPEADGVAGEIPSEGPVSRGPVQEVRVRDEEVRKVGGLRIEPRFPQDLSSPTKEAMFAAGVRSTERASAAASASSRRRAVAGRITPRWPAAATISGE